MWRCSPFSSTPKLQLLCASSNTITSSALCVATQFASRYFARPAPRRAQLQPSSCLSGLGLRQVLLRRCSSGQESVVCWRGTTGRGNPQMRDSNEFAPIWGLGGRACWAALRGQPPAICWGANSGWNGGCTTGYTPYTKRPLNQHARGCHRLSKGLR